MVFLLYGVNRGSRKGNTWGWNKWHLHKSPFKLGSLTLDFVLQIIGASTIIAKVTKYLFLFILSVSVLSFLFWMYFIFVLLPITVGQCLMYETVAELESSFKWRDSEEQRPTNSVSVYTPSVIYTVLSAGTSEFPHWGEIKVTFLISKQKTTNLFFVDSVKFNLSTNIFP